MDKAWVVVANQSRARIFSAAQRVGPLSEIEDLVNPAGRMHARDLASDGPGRHANGAGQARHAMDPRHDAKEAESQRFASDVAEVLIRGRKAGRFENLHVVAEPAFMGLLRQALDSQTATLVSSETGSNLVTLAADEIRAHLPDFL